MSQAVFNEQSFKAELREESTEALNDLLDYHLNQHRATVRALEDAAGRDREEREDADEHLTKLLLIETVLSERGDYFPA